MVKSHIHSSPVKPPKQPGVSWGCPGSKGQPQINQRTHSLLVSSLEHTAWLLQLELVNHWHAMQLQLCPALCNPMDCSLPVSSVHRTLQTRILEWVAMPSSRGSSRPGIEPPSLTSPPLAGGFFTTSATWEARQSQEGPLVIVQGESHSHGLKLKLVTVNIHSFSKTSTLCLHRHPIYTPGRRKPYGWP